MILSMYWQIHQGRYFRHCTSSCHCMNMSRTILMMTFQCDMCSSSSQDQPSLCTGAASNLVIHKQCHFEGATMEQHSFIWCHPWSKYFLKLRLALDFTFANHTPYLRRYGWIQRESHEICPFGHLDMTFLLFFLSGNWNLRESQQK